MQSDRTTDLEAVSMEVVLILQDHHALTSRITHVIEKLALMQREDRRARDALDAINAGTVSTNEAAVSTGREPISLSDLAKRGPTGKTKGGYTHGKRQEPKPEIDARAEMADRTDMAESVPEKDPVELPALAFAFKPEAEPENAPSVQAMPEEDHAKKHSGQQPERTKKDRALDHYAETGAGNDKLAEYSGATVTSVATILADARNAGDPRVAKGDLIRMENGAASKPMAKEPEPEPVMAEKPDSAAAYRASTQPKTAEPHRDDVGRVEICTLDHKTGLLDGPDDEVMIRDPKHRAVIEVMIRQTVRTENSIKTLFGRNLNGTVWDEIQRLNLALAKVGLVIHSINGGPVYQLRKLV